MQSMMLPDLDAKTATRWEAGRRRGRAESPRERHLSYAAMTGSGA